MRQLNENLISKYHQYRIEFSENMFVSYRMEYERAALQLLHFNGISQEPVYGNHKT